jgi:hypothetical protein
MGIDDTMVREIVRRLLGVARPDRIILFCRGKMIMSYLGKVEMSY